MHATQVHPVTTENQFHCTRLYALCYEGTVDYGMCTCAWNMFALRQLTERVEIKRKDDPFVQDDLKTATSDCARLCNALR